jgi:hypothetical protein
MTGLELFYEEAKKREYVIGETDVSSGEGNGDFIITNLNGKTSKQNYKKLAELYGTLVFYHYEPKEAIVQLFELIELSFNSNFLND